MSWYVSGEFDGTFLVVRSETNQAELDEWGDELRFTDQYEAWATVNDLYRVEWAGDRGEPV